MVLKRDIKSISLLFFSISGIVGSGWLFSPYYAAQLAGPAAIIAWLIGFVMILFIALPFAEMASHYPVAGGITHFARMSHGRRQSFLVSWANWLAFVAVAPIEVQATLQYSSHFFPSLIHLTPAGDKALSLLGYGIAAILMLLFAFINLCGIKFTARINNAIALWKIVVPLLILIVLFLFQFHLSNFTTQQFMPEGLKGILSAVSTGGVVFSFVGFRLAIELAAETHNPRRSIPFALLGSLVFCVLLYTLIQIVFIGALNSQEFAQGWQNLTFKNLGGPLIDVIISVGIAWLAMLVYIDSIASPFGSGMVNATSTARIVYAMAENHYIPAFFQRLNRFSVPANAVWLNFIVGMLFFLPFPGWQQMATILVDTMLIAYGIGAISVIALRKQHILQRSDCFKIPGGKWVACIAFYFSTLILYWSGWSAIWHLTIALGIGGFVMLLSKEDSIIPARLEWRPLFWFFPYIIGIFIFSYFGDYGGHNDIPVGWDFFWLGIFSVVIFAIALRSRLPKADLTQLPSLPH